MFSVLQCLKGLDETKVCLLVSHCLTEDGTPATRSSWTSVRLWRPGLGLWTVPKGLWTLASDYTSVQPSAPNRRPPLSTTSYSRGKENRDTLMMTYDKPRLPAGKRSQQSGGEATTAGWKGNWLDRVSHTDTRKTCSWVAVTEKGKCRLRRFRRVSETKMKLLCRLKNSSFWHIWQKTASQLGADAGEAHVWVYRWIQIRSGGLWSWFFGVRFPSSIIIIIEILRENMRNLWIQLTG